MTHNRIAAALLGAAALTVTACAAETDSTAEVSAPAVTVAGPSVDCIQTSRIRNTRVHDDYTIDFVMTGGDIYRNTLPNRCPGLGFEERFAYEANTGQLCQVDTITVLQSGAGRGPTCGLGDFVPVRYVGTD
jgi:hypothetical protein